MSLLRVDHKDSNKAGWNMLRSLAKILSVLATSICFISEGTASMDIQLAREPCKIHLTLTLSTVISGKLIENRLEKVVNNRKIPLINIPEDASSS